MATVIGLGVQFSANANGMTKGLSQAERSLQALGKQANDAAKLFTEFAQTSAAAAKAQQQVATDIGFLNSAFKTGQISAEDYATELATITAEARASAGAFAEGAAITERVATAEEKRTAELTRLGELLKAGAISEQTYARASAEASGANAEASKAEKARADALASAARIIQQNLTPQERYDAQVQELVGHLNAGRLSQEQYDRALAKTTQEFVKAESAAKGYDKAVEGAGKGGTLQFNELSGILAALPGPIGNIAGRFSGLASAGEGLGRVFSGGLSQGVSAIGSSVAGLVNPFTVGVAAVAGLGTAAANVVSGLVSLENEVEKLTNTANKLGVSFGFVQTLAEAAERSGVSFETVNSATTKLLKTLAGADEESKQATAALDRLGISLKDLEGLDTQAQIELIGQRLTSIEDPAKRAAAATAIFGKSGAELLPFFNNLGKAAVDMQLFNGAISTIDQQRINGLGDSFDAVRVSLMGFGRELITPFIGITQSISDAFASTVASVGRNIGAILDTFSPITSAIGLVVNAFGQLTAAIGNLVGTAFEPFAATGRLVSGAIDAISQALTATFAAINSTIIGFREFFKFDGAALALSEAFNQVAAVVERIATIVGTAFSKLASVIGDTLGRAATIVGGAVSQFLEFTGIGRVISAFADAVTSAFSGLWDGIKAIVGQVGGFIERVLQFAEDWLGIAREVEKPIEATVEFNGAGAIEELARASGEAAKVAAMLTEELSKGINEAGKYGQEGFEAALKYQKALEDVAAAAEDGAYTVEEARRAQALARAEFEANIETLERERKAQEEAAAAAQKAADERVAAAQKAAAADRQRVDSFIEGQKTQEQKQQEAAQQTLEAIRREQERAAAAIETARAAGDTAGVQREQERLAILEQQEAIAADIASGEAARREEQRKADEIAAREQEAMAAEQAKIAEAQLQAQEQERLRIEKEVEAERMQAMERVEQFLRNQLNDRQRAELDNAKQLEERKKQAAQNVAAIEEKLSEEQKKLLEARDNGDLRSAKAAQGRINQLKQAQRAETAIADGRIQNDRRSADQFAQRLDSRTAFAQANFTRSNDAFLQSFANTYAAANYAIAATNAANAVAIEQANRLEQLLQPLQGTVSTSDIRTAEGAAMVLNLAANAQDPQLVQQRLQTKELQGIRQAIVSAVTGYLEAPVTILG